MRGGFYHANGRADRWISRDFVVVIDTRRGLPSLLAHEFTRGYTQPIICMSRGDTRLPKENASPRKKNS